MILIIGLGNPGKKYIQTRHNIGFIAIEKIASILDCDFQENKKLGAFLAQTELHSRKIFLAKPQKFMNLSGPVVKKIADYYKIKPKNIWVVSDDVNLPIGDVRVRQKGSAGGHKGLQSIIDALKTDLFTRVRIGIAPLEGMPAIVENYDSVSTKDFVLSNFNKAENAEIKKIIPATSNIILNLIKNRKNLSHTYHIS